MGRAGMSTSVLRNRLMRTWEPNRPLLKRPHFSFRKSSETAVSVLCPVCGRLATANGSPLRAAAQFPPIAPAVNVYEGELTNRALAETFQMGYAPAVRGVASLR